MSNQTSLLDRPGGSSPQDERAPAGGSRWRRLRGLRAAVLPVILTAQLMVVLDMSIVNVALPHIQGDLGFSDAGLSWVISTYTLAFGGLLLLGARAGDLLGRRRTFLAGMALFTAGSLFGGLATSAGWLLIGRAVQGVGGALAAPATLAILTSMYAEGRDRNRAMGLFSAVSVGGAAIGLVAGGVLVEWLSWRWVMFVNVPIGAAVLAAGSLVVATTPRIPGRFDFAGAFTSVVGMTSVVYGFVHAASAGWSDPLTLAGFVIGTALLVAFVFIERRAEQPITPLQLFADRVRSGANLTRLLMFAGMTGMFFFLTQFVQDIWGYSPLRTGMAFLPVTVMLFISSQVAARWLMQRYAERVVIGVGVAVSAVSFGWLSQLSVGSSYLDILGPLLLMGIGNGTAVVPLTTAGVHGVEPRLAGAASGLVNVSQQVGASLGLAVLVTVFGAARDSAVGESVRQLFVSGADAAFLMAAALLAAALGVVAVLLRRRTSPETEVEAEAA